MSEQEATVKVCRDCGETKALDEFNLSKLGRFGRAPYCKPCHRSRAKAWQQGPGKERHAEAVNRWRRGNGQAKVREDYQRRLAISPEKISARKAVRAAVLAGILVRPSKCSRCGKATKPQAHHPSYESDRWLDVVWLCTTCHYAIHNQRAEDVA